MGYADDRRGRGTLHVTHKVFLCEADDGGVEGAAALEVAHHQGGAHKRRN
jgi:hypothetical protein